MTYRIRRHVEVEGDILELAIWMAKDSREAVLRFFDAVEEAAASLRTIPGFPNHLILYDIRGEDVLVLAIVHGARDYSRLLRSRVRK